MNQYFTCSLNNPFTEADPPDAGNVTIHSERHLPFLRKYLYISEEIKYMATVLKDTLVSPKAKELKFGGKKT